MFWSNSDGRSKSYIELSKKNLFLVDFIGLGLDNDGISWNSSEINEANLKFIVKKIDAPSLNLNFERAYASNYVHYFQQGEIYWEPINITFVDAVDSTGVTVPNWKLIFNQYLKGSLISEANRTTVLNMPIFCSSIKITQYQSMANLASPLATQMIIEKPMISKISFGSFDYGSDDANEVTVTFVPTWVTLSDPRETTSATSTTE